jgi:hypothetical protein
MPRVLITGMSGTGKWAALHMVGARVLLPGVVLIGVSALILVL